MTAFEIPNIVKLDNGCIMDGEESFLFLLSRVASLKTLIEHEQLFGIDYTILSRLDTYMVDFIFDNFSELVLNNVEWFFPRFANYNEKIKARIVPPIPVGVQNVALFTDGYVHQICKPSDNDNLQLAVWSAKDRCHGLKFHGTGGPDGICVQLTLPEAGRHHDKFCLRKSRLNVILSNIQYQRNIPYKNHYITYLDKGYESLSHCRAAFHGDNNLV